MKLYCTVLTSNVKFKALAFLVYTMHPNIFSISFYYYMPNTKSFWNLSKNSELYYYPRPKSLSWWNTQWTLASDGCYLHSMQTYNKIKVGFHIYKLNSFFNVIIVTEFITLNIYSFFIVMKVFMLFLTLSKLPTFPTCQAKKTEVSLGEENNRLDSMLSHTLYKTIKSSTTLITVYCFSIVSTQTGLIQSIFVHSPQIL